MLSFNTVHAVADCLVNAVTHSPDKNIDAPPTLLILQDYPDLERGPSWRTLRTSRFALTSTLPLPAVLTRLTNAVDPVAVHTDTATIGAHGVADVLGDPTPELRLLAVAVRYDDVHADTDRLRTMRRVDAVDVSGRVYQLTLFPAERTPVVFVDDAPDPNNLPATHPGLAGLVQAGHLRAAAPRA